MLLFQNKPKACINLKAHQTKTECFPNGISRAFTAQIIKQSSRTGKKQLYVDNLFGICNTFSCHTEYNLYNVNARITSNLLYISTSCQPEHAANSSKTVELRKNKQNCVFLCNFFGRKSYIWGFWSKQFLSIVLGIRDVYKDLLFIKSD